MDIFFVLSGFLITRILLSEHDATGRIRLSSFYLRRFLRLYPALFTVCFVVAVLAVVTGRNTASVVGESAYALIYVSNIHYDLWGSASTLLFHTWTLALEEQFYLVWPPLLMVAVALRRYGRVLRWVGYAALVVGSVGLLLVLANALGLTSYLRATGLLLGCGLAIAMNARAIRLPPWLALTSCLLLIVVTFWPFTLPGGIFQNGYSPTALLTVPAIIAMTDDSTAATRVLSWRPMIWVGRRSYGIYLWHFPILALAIHQAPQAFPAPARIMGGIVATAVIAALSYRFIELPFLRLKARYSPGLGLPTTTSSKSTSPTDGEPTGSDSAEPEVRSTK